MVIYFWLNKIFMTGYKLFIQYKYQTEKEIFDSYNDYMEIKMSKEKGCVLFIK